MKVIVVGIVCALAAPVVTAQIGAAQVVAAQAAPHVPLGIVSDWTHRHVLYPDSKDDSVMTSIRRDPRWVQNWYLRHPETWWPEHRRRRHHKRSHRDWSVQLSVTPQTAAFEPLFDFSYGINLDTGYGSVNTTDAGGGRFLAASGFLAITATGTGVPNGGVYPLFPGGPNQTTSPSGKFLYDNLLYPGVVPPVNNNGPLFIGGGFEFNLWSNFPGPDNYEFDDYNGIAYTNDAVGPTFTLSAAPGGGQTTPAKFIFDVYSTPSCTNDFVVIGIPTTPASGGQANIVGVNNLYSGGAGALCPTGPTVMFAYASGTGQVPASVAISQDGTQLAYIENLPSGSSYFHILTIGTTGTNGTSAITAVVPGIAGGNNAVDQTVLLSPDGGTTNQSSTNTVWVVYTHGDASDVAYATTYSAQSGSGYLYKISSVFNGGVPTIVWSVPINAVPSTPVYDSVSNKVFFTDSSGRIDYVLDTGASPSVVYGAVLATGATSENPVIVDSTNQMVYATFNSNGTNSIVVQAPTSLASAVSVPVGTAGTAYSSPYEPDFNNAWYKGSGTPLLYIAGTGAGNLPTLYSVGFNGSGVMNSSADATTAALATGIADSSPVTEFFSATLQKDYLFVGVTNNCAAVTSGGTAGCIMSLDITTGFPTVSTSSTALPATGGTTAIIVDNDSGFTEAASIYYATKTGATLVKATQSGLN
ncbi:MAG TPA: hypothetical protein VJ999_10940 [Candidatus Sulfotelmatobacter sp.]|nr:hypothetical protein [Candidatus Sulfotelmatobacter sp.]